MFSHVTVGCSDLGRATLFYDAVLEPLGLVQRPVSPDGGPASSCWIAPGQALPRFYVYEPFDRKPASIGNGSMVAFLAPASAAVDRAYAAGLAAGGTDEGAPGPRPHYGDGYYGAYLRDPDGNKIHLVFRGDLQPACSAARQI
ncbi:MULTISPECIES: VOC family protein [unclassified Ensifer]|uniref:VOC family protein n=1 Tax=unclassified Ensifer TaxID=2633371 RepID=UPI000813AD4A|nr:MULTISPECIES: VOC family protein [unclassified Ensifer]OCP15924.1 lactoylglutathione lyase [Ensifer sp. LC384]OCP19994.1 lactoylglutathione lyase [Ensifer sp. LC54]